MTSPRPAARRRPYLPLLLVTIWLSLPNIGQAQTRPGVLILLPAKMGDSVKPLTARLTTDLLTYQNWFIRAAPAGNRLRSPQFRVELGDSAKKLKGWRYAIQFDEPAAVDGGGQRIAHTLLFRDGDDAKVVEVAKAVLDLLADGKPGSTLASQISNGTLERSYLPIIAPKMLVGKPAQAPNSATRYWPLDVSKTGGKFKVQLKLHNQLPIAVRPLIRMQPELGPPTAHFDFPEGDDFFNFEAGKRRTKSFTFPESPPRWASLQTFLIADAELGVLKKP